MLSAAFATATFAQSPLATIRGRVVDPSNAAIAGAAATLVAESTGQIRRGTTGPDGTFVIGQLAPGTYRLELAASGFKKSVSEIDLLVGQDWRAELALEVGAVTETVQVAGERAETLTGEPAVRTVVDNHLVTTLPLDGRNFLELSLLAPGTAPAAQGSAASVRGDFAFNVNGAREDTNNFLIDGSESINPTLNTPALRPPVDGIREFEVLTSNYDVTLGRQGAGQVSIVLNSGGNRFTGSAYEFFRSGAFNSRNYFAPEDEPAPDFERHQFGGAIGGPIKRNRTFFFADYEGTRLDEGITRVTNVPTLAERNGDFSQSAFGVPINFLTGQPFPGGRIPIEFQHPVGRAIAALYPLPNRDRPLQNYVSSPLLSDHIDQLDGRVTHAFGEGSTLSLRYSLADRDLFEPFTGPTFSAVPGYGDNVARRTNQFSVSDARVFSSLLNDARFAFSRVTGRTMQELRTNADNSSVGLPEPWSNPRDEGLSFISITGLSALGDKYNNPQESTINIWQFADTLTWTRGAHLFKFGGDIRGITQDAFRDVQGRGTLNFASQGYTGVALADLLMGLPVFTGVATYDNPQRLRGTAFSLFAQDSWQVRPDLTLTAGLRYDLAPPPVDRDDRATVYDPASGTLVQVGTNGIPRGAYDTDANNIAPRLGVAWKLPWQRETTLRGGYGTYYTLSALASSEGLYFSPPYYEFSAFAPLPGLPPLTLSNPFPTGFPSVLGDSAASFQSDFETAFYHQFSLLVQTAVGAGGTVEVGYVGSRGRHLIRGRDINQPAPSTAPFNPRPNPFFGDILGIESEAHSTYDSFQARYQQRYRAGLSMIASYTLGRSWDDASGFFASAGDANFPQDSNNPDAEWARSSFDVRHRVSVAGSWDVPFEGASGSLARALLANWQLSGVLTLQSGRPFTVGLSQEFDNSNTGRTNLGFGAGDRPNLVGDPTLDDPSPTRWLNTSAFAIPAYGTFGNAGRNIVEGPGFANLNLGFLKRVPVGPTRLELRLELFNVFNRANFGLPDNFFLSPTFGQVLTAGSPRRLQLGAKLLF